MSMDASLRILIESALVRHTAFQQVLDRGSQLVGYRMAGGREPACLAVIGESRTGKSRSMEALQRAYPTTRTAEGLVIPILAISVPSKPTPKSFVERFLKKMKVPDWDRGTETQKTARFHHLVEQCGVLVLVVDDFHHFYDKASHKVQYQVTDWLKISMQETGVSVIASGLPSMRDVINKNEQLEGRFGHPVVMPRFNWAEEDSQGEWLGVLDGFDEVLAPHFDMPKLGDDELAFRMYCATGGLIGYLTNVLRQMVWNACGENRRKITLADLDVAYRQAVWRLDERKVGDDEITPLQERWDAGAIVPALAAAAEVGKPVFDPAVPKRTRANPDLSKILTA